MKSSSSIKLLRTIGEMRSFADEARKRKKKVGLVPTMGGFHDGHLSLVRAAKKSKRCDLVVVSIFVNPTQFGPYEDLANYPRDLEGDLEKLQKLGGVAAVFAPQAVEIFPPGYKTYVEVEDLSRRLCGRNRPSHFRGVTTVVLKLLNIIQPQIAFFGEKDYQQLLIIRKMAQDLNLDVQVEGRPTVREADGLALSTRNAYLTPEQRPAALSLRKALEVAEKLIISGERSASIIISNMREAIRSEPGADIEYIAISHPDTLADLEAIEARSLIALAIRVGKARLIDNLFVDLLALERKERSTREKKVKTPPPRPSPSKASPARAPSGKAAAKKTAPKKPAAKARGKSS